MQAEEKQCKYSSPGGSTKNELIFLQPLKIKDFRRFLFLQVLKMYVRTLGIG